MQFFALFVCILLSPLDSFHLKVPRSWDAPGSLGHRHCAVVAGSVVVLTTSRVYRSAEVITVALCVHSHLVIAGANGRTKAIRLVAGAGHRQEVHDETPDVEDVAERDDPLKDGGLVDLAATLKDTKGDSETTLQEDESELDPEADGEDAVFSPVNAETLVFGANEDGRDDVATAANIYQYTFLQIPSRQNTYMKTASMAW